jgi:hypothetical protein
MKLFFLKLKKDISRRHLYISAFIILVCVLITVLIEFPGSVIVLPIYIVLLLSVKNYKITGFHFFTYSFGLLIGIVIARIAHLNTVSNNLGIWFFLLFATGIVVHLKQLREN